MRPAHPHALAAATSSLVGCVLLTACSGTSSTHGTTGTAAAAARGTTTASTSPSPAAASGVNAAAPPAGSSCGLVTAGDVGTATGQAMGPGADAGTICSYSATADPSTVVYVQRYTDPQSMAPAKATEPGSQHLPGLGDDAFWTAAGTLFVQKDGRGFTISTPSLALTSSSAPQAVLALAARALSRL